MSFTAVSLMAGVAALAMIAVIAGTQIYLARRRQRRFHSLELVPNILMTRFPLMFVGRPRSLFRLAGDFLELPVYLQEHGFAVEEIEMRSDASNFPALLQLLSTNQAPVHLIVGRAFADAAYDLAFEGHPKLATLTLIGTDKSKDGRLGKGTLHLRPTRLPIFEKPELRPSVRANSFATEEIALKHMVSLAEYDLR